MALPKGFGRTIKGLIAQGYKPKDAMKEAWRIHRSSGPGMKKGPLYNPRKKKSRATYHATRRPIARLRSIGLHARKNISKNPFTFGKGIKLSSQKAKAIAKRNGISRLPRMGHYLQLNKDQKLYNDSGSYFLVGYFDEKEFDRSRQYENPIAIYNPVHRKKWTLLYGEVVELKAIKTTGEYRGQPFKHKFTTKVLALGLPNGDVLLQSASGIRLWDFDNRI
jgi:hypothetical protein